MEKLGAEHIGSLSHGTLKVEDIFASVEHLLPSNLVKEFNKARAKDIPGYNLLKGRDDFDIDNYSTQTESRDNVLNEDVWNYLNEVAPEGTYFGAHPGDGADFGFWPEDCDEEEVDEI